MVFGSPGYAAPEQYGKAQTTPRADIYSLGALLHQLLTGDDPSQNAFHFAPLEAKGDDALHRLNVLISHMVEMDEQNRPESIAIIEKELRSIGDEFMLQQITGLPATNAPLYTLPKTASWQTSGQPRMQGIAATSAGSKAQVAMVQQQHLWHPQQQQQSPATGNSYYNPSGAALQKGNWMATVSMLLGFLTFLMPLLACPLGSSIATPYGITDYGMISIIISLLLLVPPLLAIFFGHIGLNRSHNLPGSQSGAGMAKTGLTIGYIFGLMYLLSLCYFFSGVWTGGWGH